MASRIETSLKDCARSNVPAVDFCQPLAAAWLGRLRRRLPPRAGILARLAYAREVLCRPLHCPVCSRRAEAETRALQLLIALLGQARAALVEVEVEVEVEAAKLDCLAWELQEYLRKTAWSARPETPARAVVRFSGHGVA